jgi:Na+/H+ antiporter NhaD/arsenite permease-like protein
MVPLVASTIAAVTLGLILSEKINRTISAMVGAVVMVGVGLILNFYSEPSALEAIEFDALQLLLGMMILVSILEPTGFFQYLAIKAGQFSRGNPFRLLILLSTGTALLSLIMSNVTTVVLVGPLTILITELLGLSPIPYLMAQALLSDTTAIGTSVGDPASLIVSVASGYSFSDFLTHVMPIVGVAFVVTLLMMRWLFSKELSTQPVDPDVVLKLEADETLQDPQTSRKILIVLAVTVVFFIFQNQLNISAGFIALTAAAIALAWIQPDLNEVLNRIDWPVLIFITSLFIIVGGLEHAGAFDPITQFLATWGRDQPILLGVTLIWIVASLSALVANIPVTIAFVSLLQGLQAVGVDVSALWWAVVLGAGFGGNATPIGSSANIVIVSLAEKAHTPITTKLWAMRGLPVAFASCIVGSIMFVLCYPLLSK